MLCCVSKKSAAAALDAVDESSSNRCSRVASLILTNHVNSKSHLTASGNGTREEEDLEQIPSKLSLRETADAPTILLPCAICARTFKPQSLEKHKTICERSALKKRKPFDSAKQRIQGTELAEFAPKREKRRSSQDGSRERSQERSPESKSAWKETHDQLLRTLREARRENVDEPPRRLKTTASASAAPSGAPTRANEKGTCPTCARQFGIKAYDRHVAWCKERATRLPLSPATNVAKERLEARMKYRAPTLRNRRAFNREKYSPGSAVNLTAAGCKTSPTLPTLPTSPTSDATPAKESRSTPACHKIQEAILNPKQTGRRLSRAGKPTAAAPDSTLPCNATGTASSKYCPVDRSNRKVREAISLASKYVCKSGRSKSDADGMVRLNDVAVNAGVIGMTVRPCNVHRTSHSHSVAAAARTETMEERQCERASSRDPSPGRTSSRISEAGSERDATRADADADCEGFDLTYSIHSAIQSLDDEQPKDQDRPQETGDAIDPTMQPMPADRSQEKTLERTGEHLAEVGGSATRCATYVIEEAASGVRKTLRENMQVPGRSHRKLEESVATTSSEEAAPPRVREKFLNGNFQCESDEESHGEREPLLSKDTVTHPRQDFDSRTERKIRERMKALRGSTDSLISSIERTDRTKRTKSRAAAHEVERRSKQLPALVSSELRTRDASGSRIKPNENSSYWERVARLTKTRREVELVQPSNKERLLVRNRKIENLPPVIPFPKASLPNLAKLHSDIGSSADPFYLAERQMNELSSPDAPDRSADPRITKDSLSPSPSPSTSTLNSNFPLCRSPSAFVKFIGRSELNRNSSPTRSLEKRSSVIAPPSQFDDLTSSEFSSDSTETNSLSREILTEAFRESAATRQHRVVIDKSRPATNLDANSSSGRAKTFVSSKRIPEKVSGKIARPNTVSRPHNQSVRNNSGPRLPLCRALCSGKKAAPQASGAAADRISNGKKKTCVSANKHELPMSSSSLSLSSIVSAELDVKGSNFLLDELTSSFEDDAASSSYPLLRSFLKSNSSFGLSSPIDGSDFTNAQRNSEDEEENLSSAESYRRHDGDRAKRCVDSAYSSLNRKYSSDGRSGGDDDLALGSRRFYEEDVAETAPRCKMSKFCHECGSRFPETAKFCCECGVRRLAF